MTTMIAAAALVRMVMTMMTMMTTDDGAGESWPDGPGIQIRAPHHVSPADSIPIRIVVSADEHTYAVTKGFLVGAVSLVLVRRDRPGLIIDAAYDPHQIGYPPEGFGDASERFAAPPAPTSGHGHRLTQETIRTDFGSGTVRQGSGSYFLLGSFGRWWAKPQPVRMNHHGGPAPIDDGSPTRSVAAAAAPVAPVGAAPTEPLLQIDQLGSRRFLRVTLPPTPTPPPPPEPTPIPGKTARSSRHAKPFFTIVGFHLQGTGAATGAVFLPMVPPGSVPGAVEATVSFASFKSDRLRPRTIGGPWVFLLFFGDQVSQPLHVTLTKADL